MIIFYVFVLTQIFRRDNSGNRQLELPMQYKIKNHSASRSPTAINEWESWPKHN